MSVTKFPKRDKPQSSYLLRLQKQEPMTRRKNASQAAPYERDRRNNPRAHIVIVDDPYLSKGDQIKLHAQIEIQTSGGIIWTQWLSVYMGDNEVVYMWALKCVSWEDTLVVVNSASPWWCALWCVVSHTPLVLTFRCGFTVTS